MPDHNGRGTICSVVSRNFRRNLFCTGAVEKDGTDTRMEERGDEPSRQVVRKGTAMTTPDELSATLQQQHEQMLRLVARSFYRELINYGVTVNDVLTVAGHLLDNVVQKDCPPGSSCDYYNRLFTVTDIRDEWRERERLSVGEVSIVPTAGDHLPLIAEWLSTPAIRDNFYPPFPDTEAELSSYLREPARRYFTILHDEVPVGLIGAEDIDHASEKLEMRKLVGDPRLHGAGIGKHATFLFLYYAFVLLKFRKVYIYSLDINMRNLNLNGRFGFELEGVFFEDVLIGDSLRDVVRMALTAPVWLELFG